MLFLNLNIEIPYLTIPLLQISSLFTQIRPILYWSVPFHYEKYSPKFPKTPFSTHFNIKIPQIFWLFTQNSYKWLNQISSSLLRKCTILKTWKFHLISIKVLSFMHLIHPNILLKCTWFGIPLGPIKLLFSSS